MIVVRKSIPVIILLLLTIMSGAKAQIVWHVTHTDKWVSDLSTFDSSICFTSVSCSGNNCTAAAFISGNPDIGLHEQRITFFRSDDGGLSWNEQPVDVDLPGILTNGGLYKIQQIDSLNAVAIGDVGTVIRTFDGGKTWKHQQAPTPYRLTDIHFSDPGIGIASGGGIPYQIFITHDSGKSWDTPFPGSTGFTQCHSYGNGKFRFFAYGYGPVYSTIDNFHTVDSTGYVFDSIVDPKWYRYILTHCTFGGGDTMLVYGTHFLSDTVRPFSGNGVIMRSLDGGHHWETPHVYPTLQLSSISVTSPLDRDTVYAGGFSNKFYLLSTDRGRSWQVDSIIVDTSYVPYSCFGFAIPSDGHPIGIFSGEPSPHYSILTRATYPGNHVDYIERVIYYTYIYPNPASSMVTISSIDVSRPIHVIDIFGRGVLEGFLSESGKLQLDVSRLAPGIYDVLLDHYHDRFAVGKIIITR